MVAISSVIWGTKHQQEQRTQFRIGFDLAQSFYMKEVSPKA